MADLTKTIQIVFGATDDTAKVLDSMESRFSGTGDKIAAITAPLANAADLILKTEAVLAALAVGGLALAINEAGKFGDAFGEISTLISDTGAPIDQFRKDVIAYAGDSVKSIEDINGAVYSAISAGVDYKASLDFVKEAEMLAVAGRADLGATTKTLISTLNAYGESTDKAGKYSDILFNTVKIGQTTLEELSSSLAQVTGLAANAGVPFETLSSAVAALTVSGLPTSQAITGIKAALQNIIKPSKDAQEYSQSLGLQFDIQAVKTKGLETVLWEAYKATGGNIDNMGRLFGSVEGLNSVMVLAADKSGKFRDSLTAMGDAAGATQIAYDKVANEFGNINQRIENSFKTTLIEIGDKLMPQYGNVAGGLADILKNIQIGINTGALDSVFAYLDVKGNELSVKLKEIAKNIPAALEGADFSNFLGSIDNLGQSIKGAFRAIFGDKDLTKAADLEKFIQKLVDGLTALTNMSAGVIDGMKPLFQIIGTGIDKFSELGDESSELIGQFLGLGKTINVIANNAGLLTGAMALLGLNGVIGLGKNIVSLVGVLASGATALSGFGAVAGALASGGLLALAAGVGYLAGSLINQIPIVGKASQALLGLADVNGTFFGATGRTKEEMQKVNDEFERAKIKHQELMERTKGTTKATDDFNKTLNNWDTTASDAAFDKLKAHFSALEDSMDAVPDDKNITIGVQADGSAIEKAYGMIIQTFPDGSPTVITNIGVDAPQKNLDAANKKIQDAIPDDKIMRIQADVDIARIKEQSAIVQKSIEWKAKVDIADIEGATKQIEAAFASIDTTITSTGGQISSLFGLLNESIGKGTGSFIEAQIRDENERRDQALRLQEKLTEAEIKNLDARTAALSGGQSIIQVDGAGLQPHLEAFMWEILSAIQVRANAEGAQFLVGA